MELPRQLKLNRERLGLSQEEVAHRIFVSRQTMSSWETGKTYPDVQSLLLLSNLFGVSIDELVKGDVVAMRETVNRDAVVIERLTIGMVCFLLGGIALMAGMYMLWPEPSPIPALSVGALAGIGMFLVLFAAAMACAVRIERIKKTHNLVSYREISAFLDGRDAPDDDAALSRRHPALANIAKMLAGAGVALVLAFVVTAVVNALA